MSGAWWRATNDGVEIQVRLTPRATRDEVIGVIEDVLRVRVAKPPVDGQANDALIRFVAKKMGVAPSSVSIVRGETSRVKTLRIVGVDNPGGLIGS